MFLAKRARFQSGPSSLRVTFIGSAGDGTNLTTYNHGSFVIPRAGLVVAVAMGQISGSNRTFSSCTIGGGAATVAVAYGVSENVQGGIAYREMSAGTHNVSVTYSNSLNTAGVGVYLIENYSSTTPTDTAVAVSGFVTTTENTITINENGAAIFGAGAVSFTDAPTWSDAIQDWSISPDSSGRFSGATLATDTTLTDHVETITHSGGTRLLMSAAWA